MTEEHTITNKEAQEKVLKTLGIENAPQEKQEEILTKIGEVALKETLLATLERLDEDQKKTYDELLEKNANPDEVEAFLKEAIPDYEEMVQSVINTLMSDLQKAQGGEEEKNENNLSQ